MLTFFLPLMVYVLWYPVLLITLFRAEVGIVYFISFVPIIAVMKKMLQFPGGHNFADYLLIAIIIGWVVGATKEGRKIIISSPINTAVVIMVIGSFFNLIRGYTFMSFPSDINLERLMTWKNYMLLPVIYFIAANNLKTEKIVKVIIICISVGLIASTINFRSTFQWVNQFHYTHEMRISGVFSFLGPNEMGIFYSMYVFLLLGISYFIENRLFRIFILVTCAVSFYPIIYSYSRSAYAGVLIGFVVLGLLKDRRLLLLPIALVLLYSFILPNSVVERIDSSFLSDETATVDILKRSAFEVGDTTLWVPGRKELWEKAMDYFREQPVIGTGFDTFRHDVGRITHGMYHKILAEQGLVGAIINIYFYLLILRQSYKLFKNSKLNFGRGIGLGFLCSMIVFLISNITGDISIYYHMMTINYVFLGIVANLDFQSSGVDKPPENIVTPFVNNQKS